MKTKLFSALALKIKRLTSAFREKPATSIDDYVLEHFLLYNGLVGTTPENQRQFRDIRADIVEAANHDSPHEMAIALKLPPLWWEERLKTIFSEIAQVNRKGVIACLNFAGNADDAEGTSSPLRHPDWRVRSNAAAMLAFLESKESVPAIISALQDKQPELKPAFCHLAYALGNLRTEEARTALVEHLNDEEPWFRVDAAGALAHWQLSVVATDLMNGMIQDHTLSDYMAVAIVRKHRPSEFFQFNDFQIQDGACELLLALLEAIDGVFHSDSSLLPLVRQCADQVNKLAASQPNPRNLHAAIAINNRFNLQGPDRITDLSDVAHQAIIKKYLQDSDMAKHALYLAGQFKLDSCSDFLAPLLVDDSPLLNETIECAGLLKAHSLAPRICELVYQRFDLKARCQAVPSHVPVHEEDRDAALVYWIALKALGNLVHPESLKLLSLSIKDYAPDKREQALLSIQNLFAQPEFKPDTDLNLAEIVAAGLDDPATSVRLAALEGVSQHQLIDLLPQTAKLLNAKEISLQKKAADTFVSLAEKGHKDQVISSIQQSLAKEINHDNKYRFQALLSKVQK
ncbi:MAG: HEAT repeat domain-containing protein [Candidatus Obscuribacterales bacterium]|nr:HEAT repeat domain-containing protein [Candidatus Obscuribacterales bacterium]